MIKIIKGDDTVQICEDTDEIHVKTDANKTIRITTEGNGTTTTLVIRNGFLINTVGTQYAS